MAKQQRLVLLVSILASFVSFLDGSVVNVAGKYGPRWFMGMGPIIAGFGFLLLLLVDEQVSYWTQLFPGIVLFGIGLALTVAPLTSAVLGAIEPRHAGIGSAVNNAIARIAGLVAIAALGIVLGTTLSLASFHRGIILMAILLFVGGIISAVGISNAQVRRDNDAA